MEKLSNQKFIDLACQAYYPICLTDDFAFYLNLDKKFSLKAKKFHVFTGGVYEFKDNKFIQVCVIQISLSKRSVRTYLLDHYNTERIVWTPIDFFRYCPAFFKSWSNYLDWLHFAKIAFSIYKSENLL